MPRGHEPKPVNILGVRELAPGDLTTLTTTKRAPVVLRLRESHHMLARMFAAGLRQKEIVERTGYSASRISTLYADPAMKELIASYAAKLTEGFETGLEDFATIATSNMILAESMLRDKLIEAS